MCCLLFVLLFLFFLFVFVVEVWLKIGLVFFGGVVCGLVYIGVFKVFDEQGIQIDVIVGISMGVVVGGLYVFGYIFVELECIVLEMDWQQVLFDVLLCKDVLFWCKQDDCDFLVKQKISFCDDGIFGLLLGVIQG